MPLAPHPPLACLLAARLPCLHCRRVFPHLVYSQFANGSNEIQTPRQHSAMLRSKGGWVGVWEGGWVGWVGGSACCLAS